MKISILKTQLNEAIQDVSKAISNRTTIPILGGIKIEADSTGTTLTASDTEISIQRFIPSEQNNETIIELKQRGSVVLPAKFFVEIIRKLPQAEVEIDVGDNFLTYIRSGSTEIQLVGMDPEEYPVLPKLEENRVFSMNGALLKSMIRQTHFSVSTNESTPVLTGVMCALKQNTLRFTATDRHRLSRTEIPMDAEPGQEFTNVVIAGKILGELNKIIPDQHTMIDIVVADNQVLFKMQSLLFYARLLDGNYPDTSKIIPSQYRSELVLNTKMFTDAIERAYLLSREEKTNIVRLTSQEDGGIEVSSSSGEIGKVTEQLDADSFIGEAVKISFNSKYMLDALKVIDSEKIHIGFTGAMSPIIVKPEEDHRLLHLILPYRTTN